MKAVLTTFGGRTTKVRDAIFTFKGGKAPGPDCSSAFFLSKIVANDSAFNLYPLGPSDLFAVEKYGLRSMIR